MKLIFIFLLINIPFAQEFDYGSFSGYYNKSKNCPDYTVYDLTAEQVILAEQTSRFDFSFRSDKEVGSVPGNFFSNSGFDRGHMVPAEDLSWSVIEASKSYFTTNVCYQTKELNRGPWRLLEQAVRDSAKLYKKITVWTLPIWDNSEIPVKYVKIIKLPKSVYYIWIWSNTESPELLEYKKTNYWILKKYNLRK